MSSRGLSSLPAELISFVIDHLDRLKDLSALARTDRTLYSAANPVVYKRAVSQGDAWPLAWAAHCGVAGTLKKVLAAGVGPDHQFVDCLPLDDWKRVNAAARRLATAIDDAGDCWDGDNASQSTAEWSIETEDSGHAGTSTTHQPSSNSNSEPWSWGPAANDSDRDSDVWMDESVAQRSDGASSTLDENEREAAATAPGAHSNSMIVRRYTALHLAVQAGHNDLVQILLDHGASANTPCEHLCECTRLYGLLNAMECPETNQAAPLWSPLHLAVCHSRPETAKLLLSRGASPIMDPSPDGDESSCITALHHAAAMGLVDLIRHLVESDIQKDVEVRDSKTLTPLYHAYAERRWDAIACLVKLGANINVDVKVYLPYSTITPLGEACRLGHFDSADRLLDLGADATHGFIVTQLGKGLTPLHLCAMPSAKPLRGGDSVDDPYLKMLEEGTKGTRMMHVIGKLISRGAAVDVTDCGGDTPLIAAAQNHNIPALRALIEAGVDIHQRNTVGRTALMQTILGPQSPVAPIEENPEAIAQSIQILIAGGARLDERDMEGNTVLHLVFKGSNTYHSMQKAALRILFNFPGVVDLSQGRNKDNHIPLHLAFQARNLEACEVLVRRGCIRGVLDKTELMAMFADALANPGDQEILDFVLDLDVNGVLTSDPSIFTALLAKSKYTAIRAARAIAQRGLPALEPVDATRLLCMAVRMGETALASSLMACGGDLKACDAHFRPFLPASSRPSRNHQSRPHQ